MFGNTQQVFLSDGLPSVTGVTYGAVGVVTSGTTGTISCAITGGVNLACTAGGGGFTMPANATFTVSIPVSANPANPVTLANPRTGSICRIDSSSIVSETNETNNDCSDSVVVITNSDLIATKTNNVGGTYVRGQHLHLDDRRQEPERLDGHVRQHPDDPDRWPPRQRGELR